MQQAAFIADLPPDEQITVDAWIDDGVLTQLGYDLASADGGAPAGTFLLMNIGEFTGSVEAPDEATPFDLFEVIGGFLGAHYGRRLSPGALRAVIVVVGLIGSTAAIAKVFGASRMM